MSDAKPSLPADYVVPEVWTHEVQGGTFGGLNRPTAGARTEAKLPKGEHPIQLYSLATPNGQKVTILLEELGIEYDAWLINIMNQDQFGSGFTEICPNGKIPAMADHSMTPPLRVFESGSMLKYLAEKEGKFIPTDLRGKTECFNWLFWQMGGAPFIGGGFGHFFKYAPIKIQYAIDRYSMEAKRQLDVLDKHLADKEYLCGSEYTIADMAVFPWIRCIDTGYGAVKFLDLPSYKNLNGWMDRVGSRPAVKRGLLVNSGSPGGIKERHSAKDFEQAEAAL